MHHDTFGYLNSGQTCVAAEQGIVSGTTVACLENKYNHSTTWWSFVVFRQAQAEVLLWKYGLFGLPSSFLRRSKMGHDFIDPFPVSREVP